MKHFSTYISAEKPVINSFSVIIEKKGKNFMLVQRYGRMMYYLCRKFR
jgi:hypothetical protein